MKINLFYKNLNIGALSKVDGNFVFAHNDDYAKFERMYFEGKIFPLFEKIQSSAILYPFFVKMVEDIKKRIDLILLANILPSDSDFEILFKYASLSQNEFGYHLKQA